MGRSVPFVARVYLVTKLSAREQLTMVHRTAAAPGPHGSWGRWQAVP